MASTVSFSYSADSVAAVPAPDPSRVGYRFAVINLDFSYVKEFQGQGPVVKIDFANTTAADRAGNFRFTASRLEPFFFFVPPYIGKDARKFTAQIWVDSIAGLNELYFVFDAGPVDFMRLPIVLADLKPKQWNTVEISDPALGSIERPLAGVRLEARMAAGAKASLSFAALNISTEDGRSYAILKTDMPLMMAGMNTPLAKGPERPLPERERVSMGGYTLEDPAWAADLPAMGKFMNEKFPDADFLVAPVWTPHTIMAQRLPEMPKGVFFQFQKAQADEHFLDAVDGIPLNASGKRPSIWNNNAFLATNPLFQQVLKDQIDYAASLGVNNFKQVDYAWLYEGGRWGFDKASVAAYRDNLLGKDEGLDLLAGPGGVKAGVIHFLDYYQENHGFRPTPADLGIKNWNEYQPISEAKAASGTAVDKLNLGIYAALFHYEWLKQAQRFGRWAKAHGGKHDYTLNPEDLGNGGDFIYLIRLKDAGTPYLEYFGGPSVLQAAYHGLPTYVRAAEIAGKRLGLITELGMGGHGQNYLSSEVGYLYTFELAALGLANYHNEWMEGPFSVMSDPKNAYQYDRFSSWMSQAYGVRQARREKVSRNETRVLNVSLRSTMNYISSWMWQLNQMDSLGPILADANIDFQQTDPVCLPETLGQADVVIYNPPSTPAYVREQLVKWLDQGNKTLITHSYIPISPDDGQIRLAEGVTNVEFRGENRSYADFMANPKGDPKSPLLPIFSGMTQDGLYWNLDPKVEAITLFGTPDRPVISMITLPNKSRIFYIHVRPKDFASWEKTPVLTKLIQMVPLPQMAVADPKMGDSMMVQRFHRDKTEVVSLWNRDLLNKFGWLPGYGDHLLPGRGANEFDPKLRPYPYLVPGARGGTKLPVAAAGTYRIYRFLQDKEETVQVGEDKMLPLTVENALVEQFYLAPDSETFREEIAQLRKHRADLTPYFLDIKNP